MAYQIPCAPAMAEVEVKKSRFIARAFPVDNRQQALQCVALLHTEFPDARHICWAYVLGNQTSAAMSDDGEPSGTAGKPILNVLQHKAIGNVLVAVVRYFGGIKLGAGGLVRAYSGAAQAVVEQLQLMPFVTLQSAEVLLEFSQEQVLRHWCQQHAVAVEEVAYGHHVSVLLKVPEAHWDALQEFCDVLGATLRSQHGAY